MKRALVLVFGLLCLVGAILIDTPPAQAMNSGDHFVKGKIVALEGCYTKRDGTFCLGVVDSNGVKRGGRIYGDRSIGDVVYKQCVVTTEITCDKSWRSSIGESYLKGGQITN